MPKKPKDRICAWFGRKATQLGVAFDFCADAIHSIAIYLVPAIVLVGCVIYVLIRTLGGK